MAKPRLNLPLKSINHVASIMTRGCHEIVPSPNTAKSIDSLSQTSAVEGNILKMSTPRLPQKRILGDTSNTRRNLLSSPAAAKKRKLDPISSPAARFKGSQNGPMGKPGSSQPSQFESELEKMTQDIAGLKEHNSEKSQSWGRPPLTPIDPKTETLVFQQIEVEEGTLSGQPAVKLFGVTEVC